MSLRFIGPMLACSLAVACSITTETRTVTPGVTSNESMCLSYGLKPGTTAYTACVAREAEARRRGQLGPTYDQVLIARQAEQNCASYGLAPGTAVFQRCVQQEIAYRLPR